MSTSPATAFILRAFRATVISDRRLLRFRPGKIEGWGGEGWGEIELFMHTIKYLKIVIVCGGRGSGTLLKKKYIMKIGAPLPHKCQ